MKIVVKVAEKQDHGGFYMDVAFVLAELAEARGLMLVHDGTALDKTKDLEMRFVTEEEFPNTVDGKRLAQKQSEGILQ